MLQNWIVIQPETLAQAIVEFEKACKELNYKIQSEPIAIWQTSLFGPDDAIVYAKVRKF